MTPPISTESNHDKSTTRAGKTSARATDPARNIDQGEILALRPNRRAASRPVPFSPAKYVDTSPDPRTAVYLDAVEANGLPLLLLYPGMRVAGPPDHSDDSGDRPETPETSLVLTIEQAARRLGVGRTLMYSLVMSGTVRSVTIGRLRRVPAQCLDEYVARLLDQPFDVSDVA